jgi:putative DNA primase/helicase
MQRTYTISTGRSRMETKWVNRQITWEALTRRLAKTKRTAETVAEYRAMKKPQKGQVKDIGGFVGGAIEGGRRKAEAVKHRSLVTLDIDYATPETPEIIADMLSGTAWCIYTTHGHTKDAPRFRLIVPLSRDVTADEYVPIARRIADDIGIDMFDQTSYQPMRLMYWPSTPKDGDYLFLQGEGAPADADNLLDSFTDWRNAAEWPVDSNAQRLATGHGSKQEDPTTKRGIVGTFCRAYTITAAINTFLPDVYEPTAQDDRWTYSAGSTAGGLVVYDDKWAYSHHGTDPCCSKLCNAFDLVRLHLFHDLDAEAGINTPVNRLPSYTAMDQYAQKDTKVRTLIVKEQMANINEDFANIADTAEEDGEEDWRSMMQIENKKVLNSPYNFGLIVRNDPRLKGKVMRDDFKGRDAVVDDLPWRVKKADQWWNNSDDNGLIDYVSANYRLTGKQALLDAHDLAVSQNSFHPVRDYLNALRWDGIERLDTLVIDYLGAEDTPLVRAQTRKHFTAAVARVMRPGIKYDYVLTMIGPEGIGKSTLIRLMGRDEWFDDSLTGIEGKEGMEQIRGKWLIEMGELTNYKKSTSEAYKAFLSKQEDAYRPAYGRKTEVYPRQCVFFATTNERSFLKGDTGNRRFWTIMCDLEIPMKDVWEDLPGEVDQLWAEALTRYRQGEKLYLPNDLERQSRQLQELHNEVFADERIGMIAEYLEKPIPTTWETMSLRKRQDYIAGIDFIHDGELFKKRETVSAIEVYAECFGQKPDEKTRYRTRELTQILKQMRQLEYVGRIYLPLYGRQRCFRIVRD